MIRYVRYDKISSIRLDQKLFFEVENISEAEVNIETEVNKGRGWSVDESINNVGCLVVVQMCKKIKNRTMDCCSLADV